MEEKINRLSNIKAFGWTALVIFGYFTVSLTISLVGANLFMENPIFDISDQSVKEVIDDIQEIGDIIQLGFLFLLVFSLISAIGAVGIIKLKKWGKLIFHISTITITLFLIIGIFYYTITFKFFEPSPLFEGSFFENLQEYTLKSQGVLILLIAWILTRANILLFRKSYRKEFT